MLFSSTARALEQNDIALKLSYALAQPSVTAASPPEVLQKEEAAASPLQLAGYAKTIALSSRTPDAAAEPYNQSINRLRLKLTYDISPHVQVHIEHDTELRAGSYLKTAAFAQEKIAPAQQYWSDGSVLADNSGYYARQYLFRAYVKLSANTADITVGRQRIPLGTGLMWSTLDMLNPVNPLQIERSEYVGVDAALLDYKIDALSKISATYAPDPARLSDRWVYQYKTNRSGTDIAFTYGKYWGDHVLSADFSTQVGNAGLHGEWTYTSPRVSSSYQKLLLGVDYAFANTFTLSAEAYYSAQNQQGRLEQFAQNPQLTQVQPLGSRYAGLTASYEPAPLLRATINLLYNLSDHSRFVSPTLSYSISDNLTMLVGSQFFYGADDSDYGRGKNIHYLQLQYFF